MALIIKHKEEPLQGVFETWTDGTQAGEMTYLRPTPDRMTIDHTRVFEGFERQGIARQMVMAAVTFARQNGRKIIPVCTYAQAILTRTDEYRDIID